MPKMRDLRDDLSDEVSKILASSFTVQATQTSHVPHSNDGNITFPNLDEQRISCKVIDTCVLYIDIRRSTELSIQHKPHTVAKLYSAFVRAMTKSARHFGGHVRGIIGDRVMVLFDCDNCFANAVNCAILMNSTAKYVINRHFAQNEVECGIGIDAGRMLVTKTGFRKKGIEQHNYKNLVWLGRPANVASKLTDIANKPSEGQDVAVVNVAYSTSPYDFNWTWREEYPAEFVHKTEKITGSDLIRYKHPQYRSHFVTSRHFETRPATPPILMSSPVWAGFRDTRPDDPSVKGGWFKKVAVKVPGYTGEVYGGDVHYTIFKE